ncbi:unnamed protein product [Natator depressus]
MLKADQWRHSPAFMPGSPPGCWSNSCSRGGDRWKAAGPHPSLGVQSGNMSSKSSGQVTPLGTTASTIVKCGILGTGEQRGLGSSSCPPRLLPPDRMNRCQAAAPIGQETHIPACAVTWSGGARAGCRESESLPQHAASQPEHLHPTQPRRGGVSATPQEGLHSALVGGRLHFAGVGRRRRTYYAGSERILPEPVLPGLPHLTAAGRESHRCCTQT